MLRDKHIVLELRTCERAVINWGGGKNFRTNSQKGHNEGPDVFESWLDPKHLLSTHQGLIGVHRAVKGEKLGNGAFALLPSSRWHHEKKTDVSEE